METRVVSLWRHVRNKRGCIKRLFTDERNQTSMSKKMHDIGLEVQPKTARPRTRSQAATASETISDIFELRSCSSRDARFARRAARESDGLNGHPPGVALSESGNPGLRSATPLVWLLWRAARDVSSRR